MRRRAVLGGAAALPVSPSFVLAQTPAGPSPAPSQRDLWFDPTQLPSYSGRVASWLMNPAGQVDRALLREGTQIIFPASEADALQEAIPAGGHITVWGIRARNAPVVMMLAWAKAESEPVSMVAQPAWFANTRRGGQRHRVEGKIEAPLLNPQGEPMGVLLEDQRLIRLPRASHQALGDALRVGAMISAEGPGTRRGDAISIDAEAIGANAAGMQPIPAGRP